jgi:hypothetical protein
MLKQAISAVLLILVAVVSAEADGHGRPLCFPGRKGKDGPAGNSGTPGIAGLAGRNGTNGVNGDDANFLSLNLYRTEAGSIQTDEFVTLPHLSSASNTGFFFTVDNGTLIRFYENSTYVVTYTIDAGGDGPLYFQLELDGLYVPMSRYGVNPATQQIVGRALVDVPAPDMVLRLKCYEGNATFNTEYAGQNNGSISIIRVGRSGLSS